MTLLFLLNAVLFGAGLAMDAFSVSLANGLHDTKMKTGKAMQIAGSFAVFQTLMPLTGWLCVHTIATIFTSFQKFIPWIALGLLLYIGIGMLKEGFSNEKEEESAALTFRELMLQSVATSIDALSVGFTIAEFPFHMALIESLIIGIVTMIICLAGLEIGKKAGTALAGKATILGGIILIGIGIEIFVSSFF